MSTISNDSGEKGKASIRIASGEKGDTAWYAVSALVVAVLVIVYLALNLYGLIPEDSVNAMIASDTLNMLSTLIFLIASVLALIRSKNLRIKKGILAFAVSALFYFIAEVAWAAYNFILNVEVPSPSGADLFYILGSVTFVIALLLMTKSSPGRARLSLPIIIVAVIGSALLAGVLYFSAYGQGPVDISTVVDIAYPVLDLISLVFVVMLLVVSEDRGVMQAQIVLFASVLITSVSDIMYTYGSAAGLYFNGSIMDFLFAAGYLLFAIGVWRYVELTRSDIMDDRLSKLKNKAAAR